jgi:hypothetical protein
LRDFFVKGISGLGEVERKIPFIHAGWERKFPVSSLFRRRDLPNFGHNSVISGSNSKNSL